MTKDIRRVVTGFDAAGRSVWTSDGPVTSHLENDTPGFRITDVWRTESSPPSVLDDGAPTGYTNWPVAGGLVFRIAEIPPLSSLSPEQAKALSREGGMHESDSVDLMAVISGEIWGYQSDAEEGVLLKAGDTFIQRGTLHAWENRGTEPCIFSVVLVGATPRG
jgi:hypothetical protein